MIFIPKRATLLDPLDISLWQISGYRNDRVTMTRPGGTGPLILSHDGVSADAAAVGLTLIGTSYTDCLVRAEILIKGWNTSADTMCGGPACRLVGTNGAAANWEGYGVVSRTFSASSRRVSARKWVSGAISLVGTETTGLPSAWADGTTHLLMEIEVDGDQITARAKRVGEASWEHEATTTDTALSAGGLVGVFCQTLKAGMSVELHAFEVVPG